MRLGVMFLTAGVAIVAALTFFAACGGDDSGGGGGPPGSDEEYVKGLSEAFANVASAFANFEDGDFEDEEFLKDLGLDPDELAEMEFEDLFEAIFGAMFALLGPAMEDLADDLDDLRPPEDVKPFHDAAVESIKQFVALLDDDELDLFSLDDDAFSDIEDVEFPPDIDDRLAAVALNTSECQALDIFEDDS